MLPQWEKLPVSQESLLESGVRVEQPGGIVPSLTPPHRQCHNAAKRVAPPWWRPKALPLTYNRCAETKKYGQNEKKQIETPEKELGDEEIDNLSDAEFKILVIRMFTELIKLGHKMKEEMKATQREIKQNVQGTNSEGNWDSN